MPAKPLTAEQLADANRLHTAFLAWQSRRTDQKLPATQMHAAQQLGFGQSALSQYLRGAIPLNMRVLGLFAKLFECDPADISPSIAEEIASIQQAVERTRKREEDKGEITLADEASAAQSAVEQIMSEAAPLYPLISWRHAAVWAQEGDWLVDTPDDVWLPSPIKVSEHSFYLQIPGESMNDPADARSFQENDLVLVDSVAEPTNGSFVVVKLSPDDEEALLRQLVIEGARRYLKTLNPAWPDRIVTMPADALICGVVKSKVVQY